MTEVPRGRWDKPLIIPLDTSGNPDLSAKLVPYHRASKFAKITDDTSNLSRWQRAIAALGLAHASELYEDVRGILAANPEPLDQYNLKKRLHELLDRAHIVGGGLKAAARGTWLHTLSELADQGAELPGDASPADRARIADYTDTLAKNGVEVLEVERFVVNDEYKAAGTYDRLVRLHNHGGIVITADLKTGSHDPKFPSGVASQLDIYSGGNHYEPATGERTPIHPELDRSKGLLIHMPDKGEGTHLYLLDLNLGRKISLAAQHVVNVRKISASDLCVPLVR